LSKRNCGSLERAPAKPSFLELSAIDVHGNSSELGLVNDRAEDSLRLVMDSTKSGADLHSQGYDVFADTICPIFKIWFAFTKSGDIFSDSINIFVTSKRRNRKINYAIHNMGNGKSCLDLGNLLEFQIERRAKSRREWSPQ
jgi:hypothetical protein